MTASDAAGYLVWLMGGVCDDLTNMKLNKLLYYAQGHYLQQYGFPMFDDAIEAWEHGPMVASVYNQYKVFKNSPIPCGKAGQFPAIPTQAADILFEVARNYGKYTASALRNMTHIPNGPWDKAYRKGSRHIVIPPESIQEYFSRPDVKRLHSLELQFEDSDFVGCRDADGTLVLPKQWDDGEI